MVQRFCAAVLWGSLLGCLLISLAVFPSIASAQQTQGTISVTVVDPSGGVIPDAQLKLVDVATNDTRTAKTLENGTYSFINLKIGTYKLTVTKSGFSTQVYSAEVLAGRITDLKASLNLGKTEEIVEVVGSATPLIETSSSAINTTILPEQIENLPLSGRNVVAMSRLTAGYNGTWNGLPTTAQGASIDGVVAQTGRWKYSGGADSNAVTPRLEAIGEMTVSTNQLDLANGFGTSSMTITYVTRRGSNDIHGKLFEDFRNSALNAKSWSLGKAGKKSRLILNEFGGSVGGPIIKDKLFFFGAFSMSKQPGNYDVSNAYFTPSAQTGVYTWADSTGTHSVNLFNAISAYNAANGTAFASSVNSVVGTQIAKINGLLSQGQPLNIGNSDLNILGLTWKQASPTTYYYPTLRLDYNLSQAHRLYFSYNQTRRNTPDSTAGWWPGDGKTGNYKTDNFTAAVGLESTLTPTLINQFKLGYLYSAAFWPSNDNSFFEPNAQIIGWNYSGYNMSGQNYILPSSRMQPVFTMSDDMTWMKGKHTLAFGFSAYRDANKYWDSPTGVPSVYLGVDGTDPVVNALTTSSLVATDGTRIPDTELDAARQLYATLTGRVSWVANRLTLDPKTGQYANSFAYNKLNELMKSWGLYVQDSYKIKSNLTLNYGMRWDFTGPNKDVSGKYHSLSAQDMFGPSGVWNIFNPGSLKGINNPVATAREAAYGSWNVSPQPAFGITWQPHSNGNFIEKLLGGDKTVIRAGYQLRRFTEPQQFVWDTGSNYSTGLFQDAWAAPDPNGGVGTFVPGSLNLGSPLPAMAVSPSAYAKVISMSEYTFSGAAYSALDPKIRQPYTQSWNIGFQREIGKNRALEVRYVGNRTVHQWIGNDINEVNIFENGFLNEFKAAQKNLQLNGGTSFAYNSAIQGSSPLPIMTASGVSFTNPDFITDLQRGSAGSMAATLAGRSYFCNMVGATFGPCANNGYTGNGSGYPINFWMANPYAIGSWTGAKYVTDQGFSSYNSLQVEIRQQQWHGLNFTANYTWSKTLGAATQGDWTGSYQQYTLRDMRSSYSPAGTDRQHVVNVNATYDLPFGRGKKWLGNGGVLDRIVGGWTVSTIYKFQTGTPFRVGGLYQTFNNEVDGGVVLNGVTASDIQNQVGVYYVPVDPKSGVSSTPYFINPVYAKSLVQNGYIRSNTTPGTWGTNLWLHGPNQWYDDIALTKSVPLTERVRFKLQAEMLNVFNHPVFGVSNTSISNSTNFGKASYAGTPRNVEFRANIEF